MAEGIAPLLPHYDLVLIDTPPNLGVLAINALCAADGVLVPVQTEYFALEGLAMLLSTVEQVRRRLNPGLGVDGVLMTMHAPTLLNHQVAALLREHLGDVVVEPPIRRNIRLAEATSRGEPIHVHAPNSNGGQDHKPWLKPSRPVGVCLGARGMANVGLAVASITDRTERHGAWLPRRLRACARRGLGEVFDAACHALQALEGVRSEASYDAANVELHLEEDGSRLTWTGQHFSLVDSDLTLPGMREGMLSAARDKAEVLRGLDP